MSRWHADYAREHPAYFKAPRYIEFFDLPRTAAKPDLRAGSYDTVVKIWR